MKVDIENPEIQKRLKEIERLTDECKELAQKDLDLKNERASLACFVAIEYMGTANINIQADAYDLVAFVRELFKKFPDVELLFLTGQLKELTK